MKTHQIVSEDKHSFVIRHPKGHDFTVAKAGLDQGMIAKIKAMPGVQKFADGGEVQPEGAMGVSDTMGTPQPAPVQAPLPVSFDPTQGMMAPSSATAQPTAPAPTGGVTASGDVPDPAPASAPSAAQSPVMDPLAGMDVDGLTKRMQDAVLARGGAGDAGIKEASTALRKWQDSQAALQQQSQAHYDAIDKELQANRDAVMNGKVDPHRLYSNMSTGNKVLAAISLVMGGIGSGLTHQPNAALQVMSNAIDRDVDAQKANLGKSQTLFSMNLQRLKNAQAAEAETRLQLGANLQAQLQLAGMKSQSAQAKTAANVAALEVEKAMLPWKEKAANLRMAAGLRGSSDPAAPGMLVRLTVPEKQQEQAFKELASAENHARQSSTILSAFDQANQDNTAVNRGMHLGAEPASVARLKTSLMPYLKDAEGRINEQELERTDALIPRPGDMPEKVQAKKLGLHQFLQEKASFPMLKAYGIRVPEMAGAGGGQSKIAEYPAVRGNGR